MRNSNTAAAQQQSQAQSQVQQAQRSEGYPWRRVLFGCSVVLLCWGIGLYREYQEEADMRIKQAQDWAFAKIWTHASASSALRVDPYRGPLWKEQIRGSVLELGPGLGEALLLLTPAKIDKYVVLEPNTFLHSELSDNARRAGFAMHYDLLTCPDAAEHNTEDSDKLPMLALVNATLDDEVIPRYVADHAPYDTVVSSLVLCSVDSLQATLDSVWALLAPGGKFVFVEHVRHGNAKNWGLVQDVLTPVWSLVADNCHMNRRTGQALDAMKGWSSVEYSDITGASDDEQRIVDKLMPLIYGVATKE
ncbi:hypothetical protein GGF42_008087 [Coemansia sp. RSA 2424]|nr:hypothetical protein GGF42_008087 [Coemansia sp. RSA 2424]